MPFSRPASDTAFRILVLGDFGATAASSRPVLVDRDNVDQVMKRLDVRLELPGAGLLRFQEVEDFHPDHLFQSLDLFGGMRDLRADVANPETFGETALELLGAAKAAKTAQRQAEPAEPDIDSTAVALSSGSLLDELIDASESPSGRAAAPARRSDPLQKYIDDVVAQYIMPAPDPKQADTGGLGHCRPNAGAAA